MGRNALVLPAGEFCGELAAHAGFLRRHLESDVGGNHLVKNLKALTGTRRRANPLGDALPPLGADPTPYRLLTTEGVSTSAIRA